MTEHAEKKSRIYTPKKYVEKLFDIIGFTEFSIESSVLECSCGSGSILKEIYYSYIKKGLELNMNIENILILIEKNIVAYEKNAEILNDCKVNIIDYVYSKFGIDYLSNHSFNNLINTDFLKEDISARYDYIIGNPPYISYKDLESTDRFYLTQNFLSCKVGKFDYSFAFIEKCIGLLSENGKMSFIIPNSIFKTKSGNKLRNFMKDKIFLIDDYAGISVFKDVLVSVSLCGFQSEKVDYIQYRLSHYNYTNNILKSSLLDSWVFEKIDNNQNMIKFGDYFKVSTSPATLANDVFIVKEIGDLESQIIRESGAPKSLKLGKIEYIVFPYKGIDCEGKIIRFSEEEFINNFPNIATYLKNAFIENNKQNIDRASNTKWFEYGRSQALNLTNTRMVITSFVVTNKVHIYIKESGFVPYSGIIITAKSRLSLEDAKSILESRKFSVYAKKVGLSVSGESVRLKVSDFENYYFIEEDFI